MKYSALLLLVVISTEFYSQSISRSVIASNGEDYNSGGYSVSYTLGEIATSTNSSTNNILTEGLTTGLNSDI